jgi:uncharacterized membrane protein YhhN
MNLLYWNNFYLVVLFINVVSHETGDYLLQHASKPLLMPLLAGYFLSEAKNKHSLSRWVLAALFFSWAGDVLLMFQEKDSMFFMLGLSAFLLAHVFYIVFFLGIKNREQVKFRPLLLVIVAVYYAGLIYLLYPKLANMRMPVMVYGVVISAMFMLAMHMLFIKKEIAGKYMISGALLFVVSDSVLAINKFYQPFDGAGIIIMLTYGLAQLFIVKGTIKYLQSAHKE